MTSLWWASRFDHNRKEFRTVETDLLIPASGDGPDMVFLSSPGYRRNIGLRRLWDHNRIAARFRALAPTLERPDAIVAAYPIVDLACAAVDFGQAHDIPVVVDIRDLWPGHHLSLVEPKNRPSGPQERRYADSLRAHGSPFVSPCRLPSSRSARACWTGRDDSAGLRSAAAKTAYSISRSDSSPSTAPHARRKSTPGPSAASTSHGPKIRLVWAGTMTPQSDAAALLEALERVPERQRPAIQIIICGTGSLSDTIERMANECEHVVYAGWVGQAALSVLLEESHIGLMCYPDRFDFQASIPNKVADYCAAGLRILTNLTGEIARLTEGTDTLIHYPTGDASALAKLLMDIAQDPDRYRTDHAPSRDIFHRVFDADKVMEDLANHLESLAERGTGNTRPSR